MRPLTPQGQTKIDELAQNYQISSDAVITLLQAVMSGNGTMAQFNHPELGGSGQWMQGGMTMVGDMFNEGLKVKINQLCSELSQLIFNQTDIPIFSSSQSQQSSGQQQNSYETGNDSTNWFMASSNSHWWPDELGIPTASGAQNNIRYAYFANSRRLAIEKGEGIYIYDTLDHQISGVSQQQGSGTSLTFTSQYGEIGILSLPLLSSPLTSQIPTPSEPNQNQPIESVQTSDIITQAEEIKATLPDVSSSDTTVAEVPHPNIQEDDIFAKIKKLAELKQQGIISKKEFETKKAELLSRL